MALRANSNTGPLNLLNLMQTVSALVPPTRGEDVANPRAPNQRFF